MNRIQGRFQVSGTILYDAIMTNNHQNPQNVQYRMNPSINYGLQLIMLQQYWLTNCNKCTTVIQDTNNSINWEIVMREYRGNCDTFHSVLCTLKITPKNPLLKKAGLIIRTSYFKILLFLIYQILVGSNLSSYTNILHFKEVLFSFSCCVYVDIDINMLKFIN